MPRLTAARARWTAVALSILRALTHPDQPQPPEHLRRNTTRRRRDAQRSALHYGDRLRFDHQRGRWLLFHDDSWEPDRSSRVCELAMECARMRQHEALDAGDRASQMT